MPEDTDNCPSCQDLPGSPVPGQEDVYAFAMPVPPDDQLTPWHAMQPAASPKPHASALGTQGRIPAAQTPWLEGLLDYDTAPEPGPSIATQPRREGLPPLNAPSHQWPIQQQVQQPHPMAGVIQDPHDPSVTYLPPLGAPWIDLRSQPIGLWHTTFTGGGGRTGSVLIPGAPGKWGPIFVDDETLEYLQALLIVLEILKGTWRGSYFGGAQGGFIQGWTYIVLPDGSILLRKWKPGRPPVELPETGSGQPPNGSAPDQQARVRCRTHFVPSYPEVIYRPPGADRTNWAYDVYKRIEEEQSVIESREGSNEVESRRQSFVYVGYCDGDHAIILRGYCHGSCPPGEVCRAKYVTSSWDEDIMPGIPPSNAPAPPKYGDVPPGTIMFRTNVICECIDL